MPVILVHQGPTLTQDRYEEAVKRINDGQPSLRIPTDWPVEGLLVHAAGQGAGGFRVVDVWESEEAANRFGTILGPILGDVGVTDMPEIYAAHTGQTEDQVHVDMERDRFFRPEQAVEYGLIDRVIESH